MAHKLDVQIGWRKNYRYTMAIMLLACTIWQCTQVKKASVSSPVPSADRSFTILQINDVYRIEGIENGTRGSLSRLRTLRKQLEAKDDVLVLHAGDFLFPSVMSRYSQAKTMIDTLNRLDGDAAKLDERLIATFGNHEFDKGREIFDARVRGSGFHWLGTNLFYLTENGSEPKPMHQVFETVYPHLVVDIAGIKVGLFSITLDDYTADYVSFDYDETRDQKQIPAIRDTVAYLRDQKVDVLIALTHQTLAMDQKLACDVGEIDLIIGGHEHIAINSDGCDTSITKADADALTAWVISIDVRQQGPPLIKKQLVKLDESVEKDPELQAFIEQNVAALSKKVPDYFTVYGSTVHLLEGLEPAIRGRETALGNWLTEVARERMGTEIAFLNGGGIRINDNIPAGGDIRGEQLAGIFYYPTELVSMNLRGSQIKEILNNSVSQADRGAGRFLQVSGMRFKFRKANEAEIGVRFVVVDDTIRMLDAGGVWRPLELDRTYSVTTSKYLWSNGFGDGYAIFSKGDGGTSPVLTSDPNTKVDLRQTIEHWLKLHLVVRQNIDGRIGRFSPPKG